MKRYIAKCNKVVSCIYGTRQLVEGLEVPEIFARRFPQYVNCIETPDPVPVPMTTTDEIIETIKSQIRKKGN